MKWSSNSYVQLSNNDTMKTKKKQMPRVNWETVVVPSVELMCYLMKWSGNGYVQLSNNRAMPWVHYASWLMTTPALLFQVPQKVVWDVEVEV